jgi:hypothetical protein
VAGETPLSKATSRRVTVRLFGLRRVKFLSGHKLRCDSAARRTHIFTTGAERKASAESASR